MQYLLLIYENESHWETASPDEQRAMFKEYGQLSASLQERGKYIAGNALEPTTAATTVRVRNGKQQTTDGPFAETREQLGGYYTIDADNLDEAIAIAARIPAARNGGVEVRPIMKVPSGPPATAGAGAATA
jgi:hypothetical protein